MQWKPLSFKVYLNTNVFKNSIICLAAEQEILNCKELMYNMVVRFFIARNFCHCFLSVMDGKCHCLVLVMAGSFFTLSALLNFSGTGRSERVKAHIWRTTQRTVCRSPRFLQQVSAHFHGSTPFHSVLIPSCFYWWFLFQYLLKDLINGRAFIWPSQPLRLRN